MTPAARLMMAAELTDDAPELGEALETGARDSADFEGLFSRGLVRPDGELTRDGEIVLALLIAARGEGRP